MQIFDFFNAADLNTGTFINTRVDKFYNVSVYGKDDVTTDVDISTSVQVYGTSLLPTTPSYASWARNTDESILTYVAGESITLTGTFRGIDLIYVNSPQGAFVRHDLDGVNVENVSTYGATGTQTVFRIPGSGAVQQTLKITNTGFADKTGIFYSSVTNVTGTTFAANTSVKPNGSQSINETWTLTGVNGTEFSVKRNSTGVTTNYLYNENLTNAILGFNLYITPCSIGDQATFSTRAPMVNLLAYNKYPDQVATGQWTTPVLDSGDPNSVWLFAENEANSGSTTSYCSQIQIGDTPTIDNSWVNIIPTEAAVIDYTATQQIPAYRSITTAIGQTGQYAVATFSVSSYTDRITNPRVYVGSQSESLINLTGPVVNGPMLKKLQYAICGVLQKLSGRVNRFVASTAISSSEREFLIQRGISMGFPIRKGESLSNYRNRLTLIAQAASGGATIQTITSLINSFLNTNSVYLVTPQGSAAAWTLGVSSIGISTILGTRAVGFWKYEVHVPGALPGLIPDQLEKFVSLINPVGAIPTFIYE